VTVANSEREKIWQERVAQWQASGLSQRAYAIEQGFPIRQVGYWVRRLAGTQGLPALLPVRVARVVAAAAPINLRSENGWTLTLPGDVPASWLAELMRAL
jgi:hypothetical protein